MGIYVKKWGWKKKFVLYEGGEVEKSRLEKSMQTRTTLMPAGVGDQYRWYVGFYGIWGKVNQRAHEPKNIGCTYRLTMIESKWQASLLLEREIPL